jgi:DNA modification methylase
MAAKKAGGVEYIRTIPWIHRNGTPQKTGDRPAQCHEDVLFFHRPGKKVWYGTFAPEPYDFQVVGRDAGEPRVHETQKPRDLMERILKDTTERGAFVLDSCAGSGTTLVAAVRLGRYVLGYERDRKAHDRALSRMGIVKEQLVMLE